MKRIILLALCAATAACVKQVDQSPEKQALADELHAYIMERTHPFPIEPGRKVMYGCIRWPVKENTSPTVELINWSYTEPHEIYAANIMEQMRISAKGNCEARRTKNKVNCTCQQIDENGENVILVPGT